MINGYSNRVFLTFTVLCTFPEVWSNDQRKEMRPVVMIHGINSSYETFDTLFEMMKEDFPMIIPLPVNAYNGKESAVNLQKQVEYYTEVVFQLTEYFGEITLLGHSQGGLIAKAVVQYFDNPKIHTLITLSSPLAGQFGIPRGGGLPDFGLLANLLAADEFYNACYTNLGQAFSFCNYWKDIGHKDLYLETNFLPVYNNEKKHAMQEPYKERFSNLKKLVLVGGPDDEVIKPWQSAHFGFYDDILSLSVSSLFYQDFYESVGLKSLHENNRLELCVFANVLHSEWLTNRRVYESCIKPFL